MQVFYAKRIWKKLPMTVGRKGWNLGRKSIGKGIRRGSGPNPWDVETGVEGAHEKGIIPCPDRIRYKAGRKVPVPYIQGDAG